MFSDPIKNIKAFGLRENDIVADLGAGTGFYSIASGHIVQKGKVYAIEIDRDFLATIKAKVKEAHLNNVEILWGNVEKIGGTKLQDASIDAVVASNVFFQVSNKDKFIDEVKRILKKQGRVLLIDWTTSSIMVSKGAVDKKKVLDMFSVKGFVLEREIDAGKEHYGMILRKDSVS